MSIPASKAGALQMLSTTKNCDFLETGFLRFFKISIIYGDHLSK
jgi:hypothetical protein